MVNSTKKYSDRFESIFGDKKNHTIETYNFSISPAEEFLCAVRTICEKYNVREDDLLVFTDIGTIEDRMLDGTELGIYFVSKFPVEVPIPDNMKTRNVRHLPLFQVGRSSRVKYQIGIAEYCCVLDGLETTPRNSKRKIQYWHWMGNQEYYHVGSPVFFMRKKDWFSFYKCMRRRTRRQKIVDIPILPKGILQDVYQNSIGFLLKGQKAFSEYNMPFKRGIILSSGPGLGKTMTCRWIKQLCMKHGFGTKIVTLQDYRHATSHGRMDILFSPFHKKKGIVFFDDLDVLLMNRKTGNIDVLNFLSGLDGMNVTEGIVYIFTTNEFEGLDKAAIRPNHIDVFIRMTKPDKSLREEFIKKKFPEKVQSTIDIENLIEQSDGYSFAELEEVRRLFCMDLIEKREIDLDKTMALFKEHRKEFPNFPSMGFKTGDYEESETEPLFPYVGYGEESPEEEEF